MISLRDTMLSGCVYSTKPDLIEINMEWWLPRKDLGFAEKE